MRAKDSARLSAVRLLLSGIKQREVDERKELTDVEVTAVIEKMIKQRRESIAQYEKAARKDLVDAEKFELDLWYVSNRNLWLDLRILWMTAIRVLRRDGVSAASHATMPEFMGRCTK